MSAARPSTKPPPPRPPILVAGLARAGSAALDALLQDYGPADLYGWDATPSADVRHRAGLWRAKGLSIALGGDGLDSLSLIGPHGTIIKSPGIERGISLLTRADAVGVAIIDELELGWRRLQTPVVGVTGTNGKSTTCSLVAAVLRSANRSCQIAGNTEFGAPLSASAPGSDGIVCEVSSFQLEASPSFRPEFAIFTNLTPEHLTRHGTMANYGATKKRMFVADGQCAEECDRRTCGTAIINTDDAFGAELLASIRSAGGRALSYGFTSGADVELLSSAFDTATATMRLRWCGETFDLVTRLPGHHNALNVAAAFAFGAASGFDLAAVTAGLEQAAAPPGRWQIVPGNFPFDVIVDYAHTPDGLTQTLSAAKAVVRRRGSRLHTVFGPVGLPDPLKAAGCAAAIAAWSDNVILTTGSAPQSARIPRIKELRDVIRTRAHVEVVLSRSAAIARAIDAAKPGDIVGIFGIGALRRLIVDAQGTIEPCDDVACARRHLEGIGP